MGIVPVRSGAAVSCTDDCDPCDDSDTCALHKCINGFCSNEPNIYSDVNANGTVNIFDLLAVPGAFAGNNACGCPADP